MRFSVQIAIGFTRIVFLTKNYVFKIPRLQIFTVLKYVYDQQKKYGNYYEFDYRTLQWVSGWAAVKISLSRMFTIGFEANWREMRRWFRDRHHERVPIKFCIPLFLVVMPRGETHPYDNRPDRRIYDANHDRKNITFRNLDDRPANKVIINGSEKFCDYGSIEDPVVAR